MVCISSSLFSSSKSPPNIAELPPRRRRSSLIRLEDNYDPVSGLSSRSASGAPAVPPTASSSPASPSASALFSASPWRLGVAAPGHDSPSSPSASWGGAPAAYAHHAAAFSPLQPQAARPQGALGAAQALAESGRHGGTRRGARDGQSGEDAEREHESHWSAVGRRQAADEVAGERLLYPAPLWNESCPADGFVASSPPFAALSSRELDDRPAVYGGVPRGLREEMTFFEQISQQLRGLQLLCDRQKADALRAPIDAACSREPSMLSFGRSVSGTLSAGLACPLAFVCAFDRETEELYCCFSSLPLLHRLRPSSSLSSLPPRAISAPRAPFDDRQAASALAAVSSALHSSFAPRPQLCRAATETAFKGRDRRLRQEQSPSRRAAGGAAVSSPRPWPRHSTSFPPCVPGRPSLSSPSTLTPPTSRVPSAQCLEAAGRCGAAQDSASARRQREEGSAEGVLQQQMKGAAAQRRAAARHEEEGRREAALPGEDGAQREEKAATKRSFFSLIRGRDLKRGKEDVEKGASTGQPAGEGLRASGLHSWFRLAREEPKRHQVEEAAVEKRALSRERDGRGVDEDPRDQVEFLDAEGGDEDEWSGPACFRAETAHDETLVQQLHQFLRWRIVDDRRATDTVSFTLSPLDSLVSPPSTRHASTVAPAPPAPAPPAPAPPAPAPPVASHLPPSPLAGAMMERQRQEPPSTQVFRLHGAERAREEAKRAQQRSVNGATRASEEEEGEGGLQAEVTRGRERKGSRDLLLQDSAERDADFLLMDGREGFVLSPHTGCIGSLLHRVQDRTAAVLYDPSTDALLWSQAEVASLSRQTSARSASPRSAPSPPSLSSSPAGSDSPSSVPESCVGEAAEAPDGGRAAAPGGSRAFEQPVAPPLRLLVRKLNDRTHSRLWELMEESRIDYSLPSERRRGPSPVGDGFFCRRGDKPAASSASLPKAFGSPRTPVVPRLTASSSLPSARALLAPSPRQPAHALSASASSSSARVSASLVAESGKEAGKGRSPVGPLASYSAEEMGGRGAKRDVSRDSNAQSPAEAEAANGGNARATGSAGLAGVRRTSRSEPLASRESAANHTPASPARASSLDSRSPCASPRGLGASASGANVGLMRGGAPLGESGGRRGRGAETPARASASPPYSPGASKPAAAEGPGDGVRLSRDGAALMGLVVCVKPAAAPFEGEQRLLDELGDRLEQVLLNVLHVEWLERERTKKALQLELHKSVFQETLNPIKKVERFLSLIHTTLRVEQVAFFIVDAQNNSFVCLGGALKARGLTLPYSHPLLGEATRQGGRIVICNEVPPGLNKEYDDLAGIQTRAAMVVPLLNAQGFVKAVLLLVNRSVCALSSSASRHAQPAGYLFSSSSLPGLSPQPSGEAAPPSASSEPQRACRPSAWVLSSASLPLLPAVSPLRKAARDSRARGGRVIFGDAARGERAGAEDEAAEELRGREGRERPDPRRGAGDAIVCACPLCNAAERQKLSYADQLLQALTVSNELRVCHKFTREDEVYLRCIQCEIQNALGGALTNVCVAGMTLLRPMVTMVSYVVAEADSALALLPSRGADHVLAEIKTIVEEDKKQMLRRLRRSQSLAVDLDESAGRRSPRSPSSSPSSPLSEEEGQRRLRSWGEDAAAVPRRAADTGDASKAGEAPVERPAQTSGAREEKREEAVGRAGRERRRPVSPPYTALAAPSWRRREAREAGEQANGGKGEQTEDDPLSNDAEKRRSTVMGLANSRDEAATGGFRTKQLSPVASLQRFSTAPCKVSPSRGFLSSVGFPFSFPWSFSSLDTEEEPLSPACGRSEVGESPLLASGIRRKRETPTLLSLQSFGRLRRRRKRNSSSAPGDEATDEHATASGVSWREDEEEEEGDWAEDASAHAHAGFLGVQPRDATQTRGRGREWRRESSAPSGGGAETHDQGRRERARDGAEGTDAVDGSLGTGGSGASFDRVPGAHGAASGAHAHRRKLSEKIAERGRNSAGDDRFPLLRGTKRRKRAASLPSLVFSAALDKCERHMKAIRKELILAQYRGWDLDVWRRSSNEMEVFFLLALDDLQLLERREEKKLRQFFAIIRDGYHTDNPYHNFYHAIHVFQVCWMFLTTCGCSNILSPVEQLGILLAALSHDVDHPGVNNAFLRASLHPLSIMYNDKAVLENHHAAFAVRTMMELNMYGAAERRVALELLSPAGDAKAGGGSLARVDERDDRVVPSFADLRKIVIQAIFSTDMELFRQHHDAMKRRAQMKTTDRDELEGEDDRNLLVTCLIHCADICNPVMNGGRNVQWASLVTQEFNAQVDLEKRLGLPVSVFMDARTELQRTQSQIGFLSFVVLDQFRALADLLPAVSELVAQGERNLEMWQRALDALKAAEEAKAAGEQYEEPPSNFSFRLKDLKFGGMRGVKCFGFIRSQEFDGYRPPSLDA
ncbi:hypothetical protein BESB_011360 [Besnoitia besnoiti]|uniref:Phosphodiesterase n=1 Tax=Besnoitia besnoiti TaxID=94643 RepID=A0A2A9MN18_BESBE|nr:hypothetical protein BESB_011360 [Besnoitia besnoiti]PFH38794.1 hypothetical protein BESB_011360 [Besnoitia besnoiti]